MATMDITGTLRYLALPDNCIVIGVLLLNCPLDLLQGIAHGFNDGDCVDAVYDIATDTLLSIKKQEVRK